MTRAAYAIAMLALLPSLCGCSEDLTEIMVVVHSDIPETQVDGVRFDIHAGGASHQRDVSFELGKPATLGVVRRDESIDEVHVVVHGMRGMNVATPEVSASARVGFVEDEVRALTLHLREACIGHGCDDNGETCVASGGMPACRDNRVNAIDLPPWTGTPPGFDAGMPMPMDGDLRDAPGIDAHFDAGPCIATSTEDTTCDGVDDDCDGRVDEDVDVASDRANCGACGVTCPGTNECVAALCTSATVAVAASFEHTCATSPTGRAHCWGKGDMGRLGMASSSPTPADVVGLSEDALQLGAGEKHTCALVVSGAVYCWGEDNLGQLGNDAAGGGPAPSLVALPEATIVTHLAVGFDHACVATAMGTAYCWGRNAHGQLGDGTMGDAQTPVAVGGLTDVTFISAGRQHTCAVAGGAAYCWGDNGSQQLGTTTVVGTTATPVGVRGMESGVASVAAGDFHTCALTEAGPAYCWGLNGSGQLGINSRMAEMIPRAVRDPDEPMSSTAALDDAIYLSAGALHTCAVLRDGRVACWGDNADGQLGLGSMAVGGVSIVPTYVPGIIDAARISAGTAHTCAVSRDGSVVSCWGANDDDQVGDGSGAALQPEPVAVTFP